MNAAPAIVFFSILSCCCGDILRISVVTTDASENTEQIAAPSGGADKFLWVKKDPILGNTDVKYAVPNCGLDNNPWLILTDEGARKLKKATEGMILGQDRLAIIVDGEIVSAPVILTPLEGEFVIPGLEGSDPRKIDDLMRKMSGRPPRPEGVEPPNPNSGAAEAGKRAARQPPILPVIFPQMDRSAKGFDTVAFVEAIKIPNPKGAVNVRDLGGLMQVSLELVKSLHAESTSKSVIAWNCDFIQALAHNFPEVAALSQTATGGKISVESLSAVMLPYINGDKSWPIKPTKPGQAVASSSRQPEPDVERIVREYFGAFEKQDWEALVDMLHPKSLEALCTAYLSQVPRTTHAITDEKRHEVEELLKPLSVGSVEEAWALPPKVVYLRMLQQIGKLKGASALKQATTTIKSISIEKVAEEFHAEAEVESIFKGESFSGTTYFIVEPFEGQLKVVAMTKTKRPPKDVDVAPPDGTKLSN